MDEKCYIGGIQRFSTEDGPGIRTTIFLKGCPLSCKWCHNPELVDYEYSILYSKRKCIGCKACIETCTQKAISMEETGIVIDKSKCTQCGKCIEMCCSSALHSSSSSMSIDQLMEVIRSDKDFYLTSNGGITLSGGEVLAHGNFAIQVAEQAVSEGISVVIETSGYGSFEKLYSLAELCELVLFDIKHMDEKKHKKYTGVSCDLIHKNLRELIKFPGMKEKIIIRVPLIHGINDSMENMEAVCKLMLEMGLKCIHILPYHSMGISKAREMGITQEKYETPSAEHLNKVRTLFRDHDILAEIMGE